MWLQTLFTIAFNVGYILSPIYGFIPQIMKNNISYNPLLSLLVIFSNILKLFPSQQKLSKVLICHFCFSIAVHGYLLKTQSPKIISKDIRGLEAIPFARNFIRIISGTLVTYLLILFTLNHFKMSHLFLKGALLIEMMTSFLHLKLLDRQSNLFFLFLALLMGDLSKMVLFIIKFSAPKEIIFSTFAQFLVNLYLLLKTSNFNAKNRIPS